MRITTWNINSVRIRLDLVRRLVKELKPDVLCLQETKVPDDLFPHRAFADLGFQHRRVHGMKGYNGVAILSRVPFSGGAPLPRCGKQDCRHLYARLPGGVELHNIYIPAGGDIPAPQANDKSLDWVDAVRHFIPAEERLYTWWSYRNRDWKVSDRGRRLDHVWVTPALKGKLRGASVHRDARDWESGSDHVPVTVEVGD